MVAAVRRLTDDVLAKRCGKRPASTKSVDLDSKDTAVNVASDVKIGKWVSVVEKTDSSGHKTVMVKPSLREGAKKIE